jgi:hypothetical protein
VKNLNKKMIILAILFASLITTGTVVAATLIHYEPSNNVPVTINPSPSPSPSPTPSPIAGTVLLTVNGDSTGVTVEQGTPLVLEAQVDPVSLTTVTFYNGEEVLGTSETDRSGEARLVGINLPVGEYIFSAIARDSQR